MEFEIKEEDIAVAKGFWKKLTGKKQDEYYEELEDGEEYDDYEYDDYDYEDDYEEQSPELNYEEPSFSRRRSKVIAMPDNSGSRSSNYAAADVSQMKMIIFKPSSYDETQSVIDSLRARKPVIVNLDEIEVAVAQRILDFISGAVYALSGDIKKAARNIFVVAPSNVEVSTNTPEGFSSYDADVEDDFY